MKKILLLAVLLTLTVLVIAGVAPVASAVGTDDSGKCGDNVTYTFDADTGTLTISGTGEMENYKGFFMPWYSYSDSIKTIIIEDGVKNISERAFEGCSFLVSIAIPDGVTNIGNSAFSGCHGLTSIKIPDSVTNIGSGAFSGCHGLTSIAIGNNVTSIGDYAFRDCTSLTSVTIPSSVTSIDSSAFSGCEYLTAVYITDLAAWCSISFDDHASNPLCYAKQLYLNNELITTIVISDDVTSIGNKAFYNCSSLTNVTISESVTSIGNDTFYNCSSLTSVMIPDSVTSIGNGAFKDCVSLTSIAVDQKNPNFTSIEGNLYNKNATILIQYAQGKTNTSFTIPNSVTSIGECAFSGCISLVNVTVPDNMIKIGASAFLGCSSLTSITIPDSVTSIGASAFLGCSSLTSITIPDSVTSIGASAFQGCVNLFQREGGVSYVDKWVVDCHFSIKTVALRENTKGICDNAFRNAKDLMMITIPNSVTSIGAKAFYNRRFLKSITIPNSVTSIGTLAFYDCDSLKSVTISSSVSSIGDLAFADCHKLTSITVDPENLNYASIDGSLYSKDATVLIQYAIGKTDASFTIPNSVISICDNAFSYCDFLTSITIPNSVTSIGNEAFSNCQKLVTIVYFGLPAEWDAIMKGQDWDHNVGSPTIVGRYHLQFEDRKEPATTDEIAMPEVSEILTTVGSTSASANGSSSSDGGCGSTVFGGIALISLVSFASVLMLKKKED